MATKRKLPDESGSDTWANAANWKECVVSVENGGKRKKCGLGTLTEDLSKSVQEISTSSKCHTQTETSEMDVESLVALLHNEGSPSVLNDRENKMTNGEGSKKYLKENDYRPEDATREAPQNYPLTTSFESVGTQVSLIDVSSDLEGDKVNEYQSSNQDEGCQVDLPESNYLLHNSVGISPESISSTSFRSDTPDDAASSRLQVALVYNHDDDDTSSNEEEETEHILPECSYLRQNSRLNPPEDPLLTTLGRFSHEPGPSQTEKVFIKQEPLSDTEEGDELNLPEYSYLPQTRQNSPEDPLSTNIEKVYIKQEPLSDTEEGCELDLPEYSYLPNSSIVKSEEEPIPTTTSDPHEAGPLNIIIKEEYIEDEELPNLDEGSQQSLPEYYLQENPNKSPELSPSSYRSVSPDTPSQLKIQMVFNDHEILINHDDEGSQESFPEFNYFPQNSKEKSPEPSTSFETVSHEAGPSQQKEEKQKPPEPVPSTSYECFSSEPGPSQMKREKRSDEDLNKLFDVNVPCKIFGATKESGELEFLIQWEPVELDYQDRIPARIANLKCPQTVIKYYESQIRTKIKLENGRGAETLSFNMNINWMSWMKLNCL